MNIEKIHGTWLTYQKIMRLGKHRSPVLNREAHAAFLCGALAGALATRNAAEETASEITALIGALDAENRKTKGKQK